MHCIAQSAEKPISVQIEQRGDIYDIWLRQDIEEKIAVADEMNESYWEYEEAYMQNAYTPKIDASNFNEWFEKASDWAIENSEINKDDLILELAADHEERLCMLEMLMEV